MRINRLLAVILLPTIFAPAVQAASSVSHPGQLRKDIDFFVMRLNIDYNLKEYPPYKFEHKATVIGVARQVKDYLSVELRFGSGDSMEVPGGIGGPVSQEFDRLLGFYVRAGWPVNSYVEPYVLAGFSDIQRVNGNGLFGEVTTRDQGFGYGAGLKVNFNDTFSVRLESTQYLDGNDADVKGASAGISFRF